MKEPGSPRVPPPPDPRNRRTSAATEEIVGVVRQNQELTSQAVTIIETGRKQAEDVDQMVEEARGVINDIQDAAQQVVDAVSRFADRLGT